MKKFIKILLLTILFVPFINAKAISSDQVKYTVNKYYVNSEIEIAGCVKVRQLIEVEGTYNGYYLNLSTKNTNVVAFSGLESDLKGSSIYNPTGIEGVKIGKIINVENLNLASLTEENLKDNVEYFEEKETPSSGDSKVYSFTNDEQGNYLIKMYDETINGKTVFYLEYTIDNVLVEHNDSAEFYYTFLSRDYSDPIKDLKIFVSLPYPAENLFKVWAHGQRDASVKADEGKRAVVAEVNNYQVGQGVDIRILFDKELFQININDSKRSGMDAIAIVEKVEQERADEANKYRKKDATFYYTFMGLTSLSLVCLIFAFIYVYFKYDKEEKSEFTNEYFRDFIEDYPVEVIEYLMTKQITSTSFSASLLNLIYKKAITAVPVDEKRKDYKLILNSADNLSEDENKIVSLLFSEVGNGKEVLLSDFKNEASKVTSSNNNKIYRCFNDWKISVTNKAKKCDFFVNNKKQKALFSLFGLAGLVICFFDFSYMNRIGAYDKILSPLAVIVGILSIIYIIYLSVFYKRTKRGNDDYTKWNAFKKFLNDFGRFDEKELPEITLWEKYLVYASVFGLADKVRKVLQTKFSNNFESSGINNTSLNDIYVFSSMSDSISNSVTSSIQKSYSSVQRYAANNMSSGSGLGGGFSSGGGFGGGGGASGGGF